MRQRVASRWCYVGSISAPTRCKEIKASLKVAVAAIERRWNAAWEVEKRKEDRTVGCKGTRCAKTVLNISSNCKEEARQKSIAILQWRERSRVWDATQRALNFRGGLHFETICELTLSSWQLIWKRMRIRTLDEEENRLKEELKGRPLRSMKCVNQS